MTLRINKEAGKGSGRRSDQDDVAYRNNYDSIFNKDKPKDIMTNDQSTVTDKATWEIEPARKIIEKKPSYVSILDAPSVLNMQDKAMWVVGYNEAIDDCNKYYKGVW